jgi:hypothetical protein
MVILMIPEKLRALALIVGHGKHHISLTRSAVLHQQTRGLTSGGEGSGGRSETAARNLRMDYFRCVFQIVLIRKAGDTRIQVDPL